MPQRSHNLVVTTTTKCLRERQEALSNARAKDLIMLGVFAPKCEADGSFSRVQCLNSSGYCWCVDREGKEMSGTKVRQRTPHCPTIRAHSKGFVENFKLQLRETPGSLIPLHPNIRIHIL